MITFIVRMTFAPEDRAEITAALESLTALSRQEPGCVTYVPAWLDGESARLAIFEQYTDEAALETHRSSDHFGRYATGVLYQRMLDRALEYMTAVA